MTFQLRSPQSAVIANELLVVPPFDPQTGNGLSVVDGNFPYSQGATKQTRLSPSQLPGDIVVGWSRDRVLPPCGSKQRLKQISNKHYH